MEATTMGAAAYYHCQDSCNTSGRTNPLLDELQQLEQHLEHLHQQLQQLQELQQRIELRAPGKGHAPVPPAARELLDAVKQGQQAGALRMLRAWGNHTPPGFGRRFGMLDILAAAAAAGMDAVVQEVMGLCPLWGDPDDMGGMNAALVGAAAAAREAGHGALADMLASTRMVARSSSGEDVDDDGPSTSGDEESEVADDAMDGWGMPHMWAEEEDMADLCGACVLSGNESSESDEWGDVGGPD